MKTTKKKPEVIYLLETNLPLAGKGRTYTAKDWKRIYGYEVGLVAGAKFIDAAKREAQLLAAAPELLDALIDLIAANEGGGKSVMRSIDSAKAIISKLSN